MGGLIVIALVIGYVALVMWLLVKVRPLWGKGVVLVAAILVPTADDMYYRWKLASYCERHAGYHIYEQALGKVGLVDPWATHPDYLKGKSLAFVERRHEATGEIYRFVKQADGSIEKLDIETLTARYEFVNSEEVDGPFIETKDAILDRNTGKTLGEVTDLNYYGGWWRKGVLGTIADSGPTLVADCGVERIVYERRESLINRVFTAN